MTSLSNAAKVALKTCLGLKKQERCIIITDSELLQIAQLFFETSKGLCIEPMLLCMKPRKVNGEEPPKAVAEALKNADVGLLITSKSLSHTDARRNACKDFGMRAASFPGTTKDMLERCIDVDYEKMETLSQRIYELLKNSTKVRLTTKLGTDLELFTGKCFTDTGIYKNAGQFGNLPAGEAGMGPKEGKGEGVVYIDGSMGFGILKSPLKITIKDGFAVSIEGEEADKLKAMLEPLGKKAFNVAEFAIGTNPKAKITGVVLEDEKVLGTCHVALGNNKSFGGTCDVGVHIDGIIKSPTIYFDDKKIMEEGKLLV